MAAQESKVLTAHIPMELAEKIDQYAAQLDRSKGWIVKQALTEWVAQAETRRRLTLEAMADVDAGRVLDHSEMEAWASGLSDRSSEKSK
jgi:predicted transcriptional regulator